MPHIKIIGHRLHIEETATNKTNGQHLSNDGNIDVKAIKISRPAAEPDKNLEHGKETQLPPTGHSGRFRLIVVS